MNAYQFAALALFPVATAMGATVHQINFDAPPYVVNSALDGVDGWSQSPSNEDPDSKLSWVNELGTGAAGAIGGYYASPAGSSASVSRTFSGLDNLKGASLNFDLALLASSQDFPHRDTFGFSIAAGATTLLTVDLVPLGDESSLQWSITYTIGSGSLEDSGNVITAGILGDPGNLPGLYNMGLVTSADGTLIFKYNAGSQLFSDTGSSTGFNVNADELTLTFNWSGAGPGPEYGDNFLLFDNINAVPEPTSVTLLGVAAMGLMRRRRR